MVDTKPVRALTTDEVKSLQRLSASDIRALVPALGLKEYWYPALEDRRVRNKPVGLMICGEQVVFFRGKDGQAKCLSNWCAHRGGSLMHGDCHYPGTISCPYHGWTYDGEGNVLAVLPEGPESKIPGKVKTRVYPTRTLKGMVFVWMGEREPAPIEEDVPPEFFDNVTHILFAKEIWAANWNVALENGSDAHVPYVHRNSVKHLMNPMPMSGPIGSRNKVVNGRAVVSAQGGQQYWGNSGKPMYPRYYHPALGGYWPKHQWRLLWAWIFARAQRRGAPRVGTGAADCPEEWRQGHHLPGMWRGGYYTRNSVPVTESISRQVYFKLTRPTGWVGKVYEHLHFHLWARWYQVTNFSVQDYRAVGPQRYDTREYLSSTDSHQVVWRRLVLQARGFIPPAEAQKIADTQAEIFSFARQQEAGKRPERLATLAAEAEKGGNATRATSGAKVTNGTPGPSGM